MNCIKKLQRNKPGDFGTGGCKVLQDPTLEDFEMGSCEHFEVTLP